MWNLEDAVAVEPTLDQSVWAESFNEMFALVAGEFAQAQSRWRARGYLLGLLSQSERKNGWTIAEFAGDRSPDGMQRLLNFYAWDADAVRDAVTRYVVARAGDAGGVVVADESGFLKKGRRSAACSGSTPAPRAGSKTVRWGCSSPMPCRGGGSGR